MPVAKKVKSRIAYSSQTPEHLTDEKCCPSKRCRCALDCQCNCIRCICGPFFPRAK